MEIITIYGEICRWKINSEGKIYSLADDSLVYPAEKGWFQIVKSDNRWKLIRMLRESRAEVYPDWIDKERLVLIDFVRIRESANEGKTSR